MMVPTAAPRVSDEQAKREHVEKRYILHIHDAPCREIDWHVPCYCQKPGEANLSIEMCFKRRFAHND